MFFCCCFFVFVMKLNIKVSNFGRVKEANLKIRPFTVIAGKNSSGKSFLTKALYSFFSTINKDFFTAEALKSINSIQSGIEFLFLSMRLSSRENNLLSELLYACKDLKESILQIYGENNFSRQIDGSRLLSEKSFFVKSLLDDMVLEMSGKQKFEKIKLDIDELNFEFKRFQSLFDDPIAFVVSKIQRGFTESLMNNFQVTSLLSLKNFDCNDGASSFFQFGGIGKVEVNSDGVAFRFSKDGIDLIQDFSNIVYLESPMYWRLKEPLEKVRDSSEMSFVYRFRKKEALLGVPQYFYDLVGLLQERIKAGGSKEEFKSVKDKINESIGGGFLVTQSGGVSFKEASSGREINLHSTATGIVNLGILSLLMERNIISTGSYIFIDEPEVNLHPAWQKVMVDALYELSKNGVNVVIATHSIDMMKCIELIVDDMTNEEANEHFGINQLSCDGRSVDIEGSVKKQVASIKLDLGESFFKMQMAGKRW